MSGPAHVCVDDASRLAYPEILESERKADTTFQVRAYASRLVHAFTRQR